MAQLFQNNAFGSLGATLSAVSTSLTLATGHGARFPAPTGGDHFLLTLIGLDGGGNENAWEIVRVTARSTDTLTVVRGQEGTTAALWASGSRVEARATKGTFDGLLQLTGGTITGPVTMTNGAYTAFKVGLTGMVSVGGEAGSADSRFTITNAGAEGLEFSQTAIAGQNRILSYNRLATSFIPLSLAASEVRFNISGTDRVTLGTTFNVLSGLRETRTAMGANNIDLATGNFFTKTISGATTLTVSNVPASGTAASFILDLTNGGSGAITWWGGMKWAGGTAPTLTASGRDVLGFYTHDGGTTWTGLVLGKDVK